MRDHEDRPRTAHEIDGELLRLSKAQGALDAELARWILLAYRARIHRQFGCGTFARYLERRLGCSPRLARDKIQVAEALSGLPGLEEALLSGARSWSAVRELVRVATAGTEAEWLRASEGQTVREIERLVSGRAMGDRPDGERDPLLVQHRRVLTLTGDQVALLRDAELEARRALGPGFSEGEIWAAIAAGYLGQGRRPAEEASYQISITLCADCRRSWRPANDATLEVSEAQRDCACCDGEVVGLTPDATEPTLGLHRDRDPEGGQVLVMTPPSEDAHLESMPAPSENAPRSIDTPTQVGHARPDLGPGPTSSRDEAVPHVGASDAKEVLRDLIQRGGLRAVLDETSKALGFTLQTVSRKLRRMVLARDQHRCTVPGCGNAGWVDLHHLRRVADGGPNRPENLITLCSAHHAQHHAGYLGIEGTPSTGLLFHTPRGTLSAAPRLSAA